MEDVASEGESVAGLGSFEAVGFESGFDHGVGVDPMVSGYG